MVLLLPFAFSYVLSRLFFNPGGPSSVVVDGKRPREFDFMGISKDDLAMRIGNTAKIFKFPSPWFPFAFVPLKPLGPLRKIQFPARGLNRNLHRPAAMAGHCHDRLRKKSYMKPLILRLNFRCLNLLARLAGLGAGGGIVLRKIRKGMA